jgi:hypothetical protein
MTVLAIDPGPSQSAYVIWSGQSVRVSAIVPNLDLLAILTGRFSSDNADVCAIEMIASYGMAVGKEVFETCCWIGRFHQAWWYSNGAEDPLLILRRDVKLHHCHSARATDANVRTALIDKYGPQGTKKAQGPTYGLKSHLWSAFAIATFVLETNLYKRGVSENGNRESHNQTQLLR